MEKATPIITATASYLFILLFVYAAASKLLEFENFQAQLGQSPLLSAYTGFISYAVIAVELVISVLLSFERTRHFGLYGSFALMVLFCAYIIIITNYSSYVPCSCGGILEGMEWKGHLVFNACFTVLAVVAILTAPRREENHRGGAMDALRLATIAGCCTVFMIVLYACSEHEMHKENPFIRRFVQFTSTKEKEINILSDQFYFAGATENRIFLGSRIAPLHVIEYDSLMRQTGHHKITLPTNNFMFRSIQVRVQPPYFFVTDGTVPVIFKGKITDWRAEKASNPRYFSKAEILDSAQIVFRGRNQSMDNVLGIIELDKKNKATEMDDLLEKQVDGYFDTGGTMRYDAKSKKFVYTYLYRNEYIVTDENLKLLYRGKTIDTTEHANIKVAFIMETGERKLANNAIVVNYLTAVSDNLLFVNSLLRGRYDPKEMFETSVAVDIYDLESRTYLSSIYLYNVEKRKPSDFIVDGDNLYSIVGHYMHRYKLNLERIRGK